MKTRIFVLVILTTIALAACATPIADQVIKDAVAPPTQPAMGDPILLAIGQPVEITNGEATLTLEFLGKNTEFFQWTCLDDQGESCVERHSNEPEMVFYYDFKKVGETINGSFRLAPDWEVKLYP